MSDYDDFVAIREAWYSDRANGVIRNEPYRFKNAILLGFFEDGGEEWLQAREGRYGGSTIADIWGDGFHSPYYTYMTRKGIFTSDPIDPDYGYWGHEHEPAIARRFQREHPELIVDINCGTWLHADCTLRLANPDGFAFDAETGELVGIPDWKCSEHGSGWGRPGSGDYPKKYGHQVNSYRDAFGGDKLWLCVLIAGFRYREVSVDTDELHTVRNHLVLEFQKRLDSNTPPEYDGSKSTYDAVRRIHPEIDKKSTLYISPRTRDRLLFATEFRKEAEEKERCIKSEILDEAGKIKAARIQVGNNIIATRKAKGQGTPYLSIDEQVSDRPIKEEV